MISSPDIGRSILEHAWEGNMEFVPLSRAARHSALSIDAADNSVKRKGCPYDPQK